MRISTSYSFQMNIAAMQEKQANLSHTQQQLATQRRILTPSDDPTGAAHALQVSQSLAASESYAANIKAATIRLNGESNVLEAVRKVLDNVRNIANSASGTSDMEKRAHYATYLQQTYQDLLGYANTTDTDGNYMFAGFKGGTVPFQQVSGAANYQGDAGQRSVAISNGRQIEVSDAGQTVFGVGSADDPFAVIDQFITDLQNPGLTGSAYDTAVNTALTSISNARSTVVGVHNQVATRLQELQEAETVQANFTLQFKNELDRVESVDMQEAAVKLQLQQVSLQATQQAFVNASQLFLFNYL